MENDPPGLFGLRPLLPDAGTHKGTRNCESVGCSKSTREGKPFCSKHIEQGAYIRSVIARLAEAAKEEAILESGRGKVQLDGFYVREALLLLRTKDFTVKSFSRRLDISHKATDTLIRLLVKEGLAKRKKSTRGGDTISGLAPKDLVDGI